MRVCQTERTHCGREPDTLECFYFAKGAGRYTRFLEHATDKLSWCNPGPGAIRGLYRVLGRELTNKSNATCPPVPRDWEEQTQRLLALVQRELPDLPPFEMREVEMVLCEVDKLIRLLFGEGQSKRKYNGRAA